MRSLSCTDEQRPHRYERNMNPVTSMAEDKTELHPLPRVQFLLSKGIISLLPWVQAWQVESVPWLWQLPRKPGARGCGDDLVVSSWTLDPDLFHTYMWQATKNCLGLLDGVCQADPWSSPSDCPLKCLNNYRKEKWCGYDWVCKVMSFFGRCGCGELNLPGNEINPLEEKPSSKVCCSDVAVQVCWGYTSCRVSLQEQRSIQGCCADIFMSWGIPLVRIRRTTYTQQCGLSATLAAHSVKSVKRCLTLKSARTCNSLEKC